MTRVDDLSMPRRGDYLTPERYGDMTDEQRADAIGKKVDTYSAGVGTIARCRDGVVRVRVRLTCERCAERRATFYLVTGSPGLCYVYDADGEYLADLRNQGYVCTPCSRRGAR